MPRGEYCVKASGLQTQPNCCNINLYSFSAMALCCGAVRLSPLNSTASRCGESLLMTAREHPRKEMDGIQWAGIPTTRTRTMSIT